MSIRRSPAQAVLSQDSWGSPKSVCWAKCLLVSVFTEQWNCHALRVCSVCAQHPPIIGNAQRPCMLACELKLLLPTCVFCRYAYEYTAKGHLVGVITNGTAVLGLGNIGPLAGEYEGCG